MTFCAVYPFFESIVCFKSIFSIFAGLFAWILLPSAVYACAEQMIRHFVETFPTPGIPSDNVLAIWNVSLPVQGLAPR